MENLIFYLFLAFIFNILGLIVIGLKYSLIARFVNEKINLVHSLGIFLVSYIMNFIFPIKIASIVAKPFITNYYTKISISKSSLIVIFEQMIDFAFQPVIIFMLAIMAGWKFMLTSYALWILLGIGILSIFCLLFYRQIINLLWQLRKILPRPIKRFGKSKKLSKKKIQLYLNLASSYILNQKKILLFYVLPITIFQTLLSPLLIFFLARAYDFPINYSAAFIAYWLSFILGRISGLPGGIGIRDVSLGGYLATLAMPTQSIILLVVAYRVIALFLPVAIGTPLLLKIGKNRFKEYYARYKIGKQKRYLPKIN